MNPSVSLFIYSIMVIGTAVGIICLSRFIGKRPMTAEKTIPYECGMDPIEMPHTLFSVKFYIVAIIFVVFDVETVFIYLWAITVQDMGLFGLIEMTFFVGVLFIAFLYVWKKGGLDWKLQE